MPTECRTLEKANGQWYWVFKGRGMECWYSKGVWTDNGMKGERIMAQGGLNTVGKGGRGRRRAMGENS